MLKKLFLFYVFVFFFSQKLQENNTPTHKKKTMKTPMKFNTAANSRVSVASEGPFQLVATPVRRSTRPKTGMATLNEQVFYVDHMDELTPDTKAKAVLRKNTALTSDL